MQIPEFKFHYHREMEINIKWKGETQTPKKKNESLLYFVQNEFYLKNNEFTSSVLERNSNI